MNIKDMVKDNVVRFTYYRDKELWYSLKYDNGKVFMFPVPIDDVGNATLLHEDKALLFMRYIRKQLKELEKS